jgi:hypothetical protein
MPKSMIFGAGAPFVEFLAGRYERQQEWSLDDLLQ